MGCLSLLSCLSSFGCPEQPDSDTDGEIATHLPSSLSYSRRVDGVIRPRGIVNSILQGRYKLHYPPFPAYLSSLRCDTTIPTKPNCHSGARVRARPFQVRTPRPGHFCVLTSHSSPGVQWLQDPRSHVYSYTTWLEKIIPLKNFAFERLPSFLPSSRDQVCPCPLVECYTNFFSSRIFTL